MKITLIGPVYPYRGGISHFTTMLAKKLIAAGHEVQVISFKKQYPAWLYPGKSDKDFSPSRERVDAEYLLTPLNPITWHKSVQAISDFKPQQVIVPWWVTFWGPAFHHIISRLKRQNIPIIILIHNTIPHEARPWDRFLARSTLQGGDRFIVMTEKEEMRLQSLVPEVDKVEIVPHPIYRMFKPSQFSKDENRSRLGLPPNKPIILFFGFIRPYKGLSELLQALKIIITKGHEVSLVVAGEFWQDRRQYDNQIQGLSLQNDVYIFDSYIPDEQAAQFFEVSDIFAAPYTAGTQSGALKAALGFGLPAVATDAITDGFLLTHPQRCVIVPAGDIAALAAGLEKQVNQPVLGQDQIKEMVNSSWEKMLAVIVKNQSRRTLISVKRHKETSNK